MDIKTKRDKKFEFKNKRMLEKMTINIETVEKSIRKVKRTIEKSSKMRTRC